MKTTSTDIAKLILETYEANKALPMFVDKLFTSGLSENIDHFIQEKYHEDTNVVSELNEFDFAIDFFHDLVNNPDDYTNAEIMKEINKLKSILAL